MKIQQYKFNASEELSGENSLTGMRDEFKFGHIQY
jgi:hypothetical protein